MDDYKYVIVGAGLSGLTLAERIANELDEQVLVNEEIGRASCRERV